MSIPNYPNAPQPLTEIEEIQRELIYEARQAIGQDATNEELADYIGEIRTDGQGEPAVSRGLVAIIRDGSSPALQ